MRDFAFCDTDSYPVVKKSFKIHERPILGFSYHYDSKIDRNVLVSVANDSVKTWSVAAFGDEMDLSLMQEYGKQRCGTHSYDILPDEKFILIVDTMNVLHVIKEDEKGNLDGTIIDEGMMQILFCRFTPNKEQIFSINFIHGMQSFDFSGQNVTRKKLDRKTSVSAVNFSPSGKYLAFGFETGAFEIRNGETWDLCCRVEDVHRKKIRVVEFSHEDDNLLIGCDDKTLSLHAVYELTSSKLQHFSYHLGPILSASFDYSKGSSQFCSASADKRVILWDTNGTPLHIFQKCFDEQVVTAVNFSKNGRYLFSGTANGNIVVHKMSSFFEEPVPVKDGEMAEVGEDNEDENEEPQLDISEDEEDVGQNLKDFDLSESDEEEGTAVKDEEEQEEETPMSPLMEVQNGNDNSGPASVTKSEHEEEQIQRSPPLSPEGNALNESEVQRSENGDIPLSPDNGDVPLSPDNGDVPMSPPNDV